MDERTEKQAATLRRWLLALALLLTFEGLMRKLLPPLADILFLLKDVMVGVISLYLLRCRIPGSARWLVGTYWVLVVFFLPVIILTWSNDPILAVFGAKQYLLFPPVALAAAYAFTYCTEEEFLHFFRLLALLIIPTSLLAYVQLRLPASNFLNMTVGGTTMEDFSAGGKLRVSATFPFVAQYTMFLNAQMYILAFPLFVGMKARGRWLNLLYISLLPLLIIGIYSTGSRGAVLVNLAIAAVGFSLAILKGKVRGSIALLLIAALAYGAFGEVKRRFPDAFAAYDARSADTTERTHQQEMSGRILDSLTQWTQGLPGAPANAFGYGLGVMSNGSDKVSRYAASWRFGGRWTETDLATTLFEGGYYLIFVWMSFRIFVLLALLCQYLFNRIDRLFLPATFCLAYALIMGPFGTLGIQPPLSIWFWLGVGTLLALIARGKLPVAMAVNGTLNGAVPVAPAEPQIARRGRSVYAETLHSHADDDL